MIAKDCRGRCDEVLIIQQQVQVQFKGFINHSNRNLFYCENNMCEDIMFSHKTTGILLVFQGVHKGQGTRQIDWL